MVEASTSMDRLADLFRYADIDDITLNLEGDLHEQVEVVFTERATGDSRMVAGFDLDAAIDEAVVLFEERQAVRQLRATGLTGSDIADLVGRPDLADLDEEFDRTPEGDAWARGYQAGVLETGELYADALARRLQAEPAVAAVGEPVAEPEPELLRLIALPGTYLALVMPQPIARA